MIKSTGQALCCLRIRDKAAFSIPTMEMLVPLCQTVFQVKQQHQLMLTHVQFLYTAAQMKENKDHIFKKYFFLKKINKCNSPNLFALLCLCKSSFPNLNCRDMLRENKQKNPTPLSFLCQLSQIPKSLLTKRSLCAPLHPLLSLYFLLH